jgi:hypothetical protein
MAICEDAAPEVPGKSWGADLKQYASQKSSLPWNSTAVPRVSYVTTHEMSRKAREVDIILMQHRDAAAEAAAAQREQAKLQHALQTGRERAKRTQQRYDIVSHASRVEPGSTTKQDRLLLTKQQKRAPDTRTPYDIINNADRAIHNGKPQATAAAVTDNNAQQQQQNKPVPANRKQREFNVLSNRFSTDHDVKVQQEAADTQQFIKGVYERTHYYNPVAVRYYDDAKEQQYQQVREKQAAVHGQAQQAKLPPSVKNGDGRLYDIISKVAKNTYSTTNTATSDTSSSVSKRSAGRQLAQKSIHERQAREAVAVETRALMRSSHIRYAADVSKGYNPITNEDYHGCKARVAPTGRSKEPTAPWQKLHDTNTAVNGVTNKHSSSSSSSIPHRVTDGNNDQSVVASSTGHAAVPKLRLSQTTLNAA